MATLAPFIPAQPARTADWVPSWRGFFGERLRNSVYGWPEPAFDTHYRRREVLGFTVHISTDPDDVERILLGNKANYIRPRIAQRILSPLIGNGLLSSEAITRFPWGSSVIPFDPGWPYSTMSEPL